MKNIFFYYTIILAPIAVLLIIKNEGLITSEWFVLYLFIYLFIYRTYTDGKRLVEKELLDKKVIWKMIIPGKRFKFFKELYLK